MKFKVILFSEVCTIATTWTLQMHLNKGCHNDNSVLSSYSKPVAMSIFVDDLDKFTMLNIETTCAQYMMVVVHSC